MCAEQLEQVVKSACKEPATVLKNLEGSPIKALRNFGPKSVLPFEHGGETSLEQAMAALEVSPSLATKGRLKQIQSLHHAITANSSGEDRSPDMDVQELLAAYLPNRPLLSIAARILTWNIKLANVTDAKAAQLRNMIETKMANIAGLAVKMAADILVLQELPGPLYEQQGGQNHKAAVRDGWVQHHLATALLEAQGAGARIMDFDFREVAVHKWGGRPGDATKDEGEHHLFAWDKAKYAVVTDPVLLEPSGGEHFHRAPCWMLLREQGTNVHVALMSCHLKSGGQGVTSHDANLMATCCHDLVDQLRTRHGEVAMLVMGDFNLTSQQVLRAFHTTREESEFASLLDVAAHQPSNMYRFTSNGEAENGHAYDGAFLNSPAHTGVATVHDVPSLLPQVTREMETIGKAIQAALPEWSSLSALTQTALKGLLPKLGATDEVPALVRNLYREEVARQWSDHVPVSIVLSRSTE